MPSKDDYIVMGIDPGLVTGACVVNFHVAGDCTLVTSTELEFEQLMPWCDEHMDTAMRLVAERFIINARTIKNSQAPYSLEAIGVVRAMAIVHDLQLDLQSAADAKKTVDNAMLHRLGLWHRGGDGHANDALRHAVTYAIRKGWRDPRLLPPEA